MFLASPPSPQATEQRPGRGQAPARSPGLGPGTLQTCRVSGWCSGAQTLGLTACAGFNPGTFSKHPTPMPAPPGRVAAPHSPGPQEDALRGREVPQASGQLACLAEVSSQLSIPVLLTARRLPRGTDRVHGPTNLQPHREAFLTPSQVGLTASATTQCTQSPQVRDSS